jgi:DNA primase catalytic core
MPLAPREEIERIKREVSIQRLAEARGIKLRRSGKELIGLCPFHKDTKPSLCIDPAKNKWDCKGACGEGGDVFRWVMRSEGISFRHALELLRRDVVPPASASAGPPPKQSTVPKLPLLFDAQANDSKLLEIVVNYYHHTLKESPAALKYLEGRGLKSSEMIERFRLGFSNRTLNYHLPDKNRVAGRQQRGRLAELGILREDTGHEHFNGSLVIPIFSDSQVVGIYGRKITRALRAGTPEHLYLPGPHRGVWNEEALIASKEIILCEALIDALTFWCAGFRNVTAIYGVNGFTDEIKAAFQKHSTKKIFIAYDRDEAGERAAQKHSAELMEMGLECFRVQFPKGMDANEYALKVQAPQKSLGVLVHSAQWLGKGQRPSVQVIEPPAATVEEARAADEENAAQVPEPVFSLAADAFSEPTEPAAKEKISLPLSDAERVAAPSASVPPEMNLSTEIKGDDVTITQGDRRYRVRGLTKNMSHGVLRVNVFVSRTNGRGEFVYHGDTFDLYSARPRTQFIKQAAQERPSLELPHAARLAGAGARLVQVDDAPKSHPAQPGIGAGAAAPGASPTEARAQRRRGGTGVAAAQRG